MADPKEQNRPQEEQPQEMDLDAALAEKFQQVREDLTRFRELNASAAAAKYAPVSEPESEPEPKPEPEPESEPEPQSEPVLIPASDPEPEREPTRPSAKPSKPLETKEAAKERRARYKKRRAMVITSRIGEVVRIFTIGVLLFGGSIFLLVGARPTESAEENRMLAQFPSFSWESLLDGSYIEDVMYYYEDTVPGRSFFKQLISDFETYKGLPDHGGDNVTFIGNVSRIDRESVAAAETTGPAETTQPPETSAVSGETAQTAQTTTTAAATTTESEEPEPDPVEVGDGIVLVGDRAISVYGGSFSRGESYADILNRYQEELGADVRVYSMVAPTAVSFYLPDSYAGYTGSEIDNIDHINENLDGVIPVDAYHALEAHTDEAIYARTDHHWLPLGAYYAAQAFAQAADVPFAPLSDYTPVTKSGYVGSMYTFTKSAVLRDNPEDFTYYVPENHYTTTYYDTDFTNERDGNLLISLDNVEPVSWYLVFMGGDDRITHVSTDVDNDRTLVIVKDSYGNALVPCLTQSFSDIYVIDMRYFDLNAVSFMQQVGATDVLFAMNTFSATGVNSESLETIRTQ